MEQPSGEEYIENVRIANGQAAPLRIIFEPSYETYDLPPGEHVVVSSKGPVGDGIELTIGSGVCTVWSWPGSSLVVLHNGKVIVDCRGAKMPSTPVPSLRKLGESLWADDDNNP